MAEARLLSAALLLLGVQSLSGCDKKATDVTLANQLMEKVPDLPVPSATGPYLGATAHATPVRRTPSKESEIIGYLHAGTRVARAEEPFSREGCSEGWYPIRPRGFVCLGEGATTDLNHPTLTTMSLQPQLDGAMPFTYARTTKDTPLLKVDEDQERRVHNAGKVPSRSGMAIVGSWQAKTDEGKNARLAMMTNGYFLDADLLEAAKPSTFKGFELSGTTKLPVGFIVKRGVYSWELKGPSLKRQDALEVHQRLSLSGRYRSVRDQEFWELNDGTWVRHRDMTLVRVRETFPDFVTAERKWMDVSIVMGTLVAYEGQIPVYATLVSVGKDRLGDNIAGAALTKRGEFEVIAKHITALNAKVRGFANRVDIYDTPWALELASGQLMHGAFWHSRFGVEHGPGNLQLAPEDARWIWQWAGPIVPEGWHAVTDAGDKSERTIVNIHR